jgi:hypothetical protein
LVFYGQGLSGRRRPRFLAGARKAVGRGMRVSRSKNSAPPARTTAANGHTLATICVPISRTSK